MSARVLAAALLLLAACSEAKPGPVGVKSDCKVPAGLDWMGWLLSEPGAAARVQSLPEAWVALYRGEDRAALSGGGAAAQRARRDLFKTYGALFRVHTEALSALLSRRAELKAQPLAHAPLVLGLSAQLRGADRAGAALKRAARDPKLRPLARAYQAGCADARAPFALQRAACARAGKPAPACGPPRRVRGLSAAVADRFVAYQAALCAPQAKRAAAIERVRALAAQPLFVDALAGQVGGDRLETQVEFYDPLALWVLSEAYRAPLPEAVEDRLFSREVFLPPAGKDPRRAAQALQAEVDAAVACAQPQLKAFIEELGLERAPAQGLLRAAGAAALKAGDCKLALSLLQSSADPGTDLGAGRVPSYWAQLAQAAAACNRSSEAIGALKTLTPALPAAKGPLEAVEALAVVRMMGGAGGDQKSQ